MAITPGAHNSDLPATDFFPITPHDTNDLPVTTRALIVSVGGTLKVNDEKGTTRALTVPAGVIPIRVSRVFSTDTAATGITGLV
jgi:hypothetical protein